MFLSHFEPTDCTGYYGETVSDAYINVKLEVELVSDIGKKLVHSQYCFGDVNGDGEIELFCSTSNLGYFYRLLNLMVEGIKNCMREKDMRIRHMLIIILMIVNTADADVNDIFFGSMFTFDPYLVSKDHLSESVPDFENHRLFLLIEERCPIGKHPER